MFFSPEQQQLISNTFAAVELNPLWEKVGTRLKLLASPLSSSSAALWSLSVMSKWQAYRHHHSLCCCCYVAKYHSYSWK